MVYQLLTIGFSSFFFFFKQGPPLLFPQLTVRPGTMSSSSLSLSHVGGTRQMEKGRREERQEKGNLWFPRGLGKGENGGDSLMDTGSPCR